MGVKNLSRKKRPSGASGMVWENKFEKKEKKVTSMKCQEMHVFERAHRAPH